MSYTSALIATIVNYTPLAAGCTPFDPEMRQTKYRHCDKFRTNRIVAAI